MNGSIPAAKPEASISFKSPCNCGSEIIVYWQFCNHPLISIVLIIELKYMSEIKSRQDIESCY